MSAKKFSRTTGIWINWWEWHGRSWGRFHARCFTVGLVLTLAALTGCGGGGGEPSSAPGSVQEGKASYYAHKFHGRTTASGEIYDENEMTAAHKTLAFGTMVRVTKLSNGKKVVVRINDRGPFVEGRIIDLSYKAAGEVDMIAAGVIPVRVEVLQGGGDL